MSGRRLADVAVWKNCKTPLSEKIPHCFTWWAGGAVHVACSARLEQARLETEIGPMDCKQAQMIVVLDCLQL